MDNGILSLIWISCIFTFLFFEVDIHRHTQMQQDLFEALRAANQNGLIALKKDAKEQNVITEGRMLKEWLMAFLSNNSLDFEDIEVVFHTLNTDPPLYVVSVRGYQGAYAIISKEAYFEVTSAATIIRK